MAEEKPEVETGAQYRVKELSLFDNELVPEGTVVGAGTKYALSGLPGTNLEPLNEAAEQDMADAKIAVQAQAAKIHAQYADQTGMMDPEAFGKAIAKAVLEAQSSLAAEVQDLRTRLDAALAKLGSKGVEGPAPEAIDAGSLG